MEAPVIEAVPSFALYGDRDAPSQLDFFHVETLVARNTEHGWHIKVHRHPDLAQLIHVTAGLGTAHIDGADMAVVAPALLALPPGVVHGFRFRPGTEGTVLTLAAAHLQDLERAIEDAPSVSLPTDRAIVQPLDRLPQADRAALAADFAGLLGEYHQSRPGRRAMLQAALVRIMVSLARSTSSGGRAIGDGGTEDLVARFRALVERHFRDGRCLGDYAADLGVGERSLRRAVRSATGLTPLHLIHKRVLVEAQRDLAYTARSVAEIGYDLGFDDPAYFSRFFRRGTGVTPAGFRARRGIVGHPLAGAYRPD